MCDLCERPLCLQVTCERGLASMEESHLKVVEGLQRRHKQEVERLLVDRDRLLEEESAATATGEGKRPVRDEVLPKIDSVSNIQTSSSSSQRSKPSKTLTAWSCKGRCRGDVSSRTAMGSQTWRKSTGSTGT